MRYFVLTTTLLLAGLLAGGEALAAGKSSMKSRASYGQQEVSDQQISAQQLDAEKIRELQEALKENGADPGPVDGIIGPKTKQAIRNFQQEQGLASTGELNTEVLEALDLDAQEFMGVSPAFGEESQLEGEESQQEDFEQQEMDIEPREQQPSGRESM